MTSLPLDVSEDGRISPILPVSHENIRSRIWFLPTQEVGMFWRSATVEYNGSIVKWANSDPLGKSLTPRNLDPKWADVPIGLNDADQYLYHVTSRKNARQIIQEGFRINSPPMFPEFRDSYTGGRIFFTERGGVPYWISQLWKRLSTMGSDESAAVLRAKKTDMDPYGKDRVGTRHSWVPCYLITRDFR